MQNHTVRQVNFWYWIAARLPKTLSYYSFMLIMCHATTGKYGTTIVPELTGMEAIKRYRDDKLKEKNPIRWTFFIFWGGLSFFLISCFWYFLLGVN